MKLTRPFLLLTAGLLVATTLTPAPAQAATTVGQTFDPNIRCGTDRAWLQTVDPAGTSYAVSGAGALTAMSFQAGDFTAATGGALLVARPQATPGTWKIVKKVPYAIAAGGTATIPVPGGVKVQAGDRLGFYGYYQAASEVDCAKNSTGGTILQSAGLVDEGGVYTFGNSPANGFALGVSATVEPDADGDGFGDQTQDGCPDDPAIQVVCDRTDRTAPDTSITVGKRRSRSGKATYEFTATEAAHFECRLTGGRKKLATFSACTSPKKYRHLKPGKYTFYVRAVDPVGNVDATPAKKKLVVVPPPPTA